MTYFPGKPVLQVGNWKMTSAAVLYFNMFSFSVSNKQLLYPEDRGTVCSHQGCSLVPSPDRRWEAGPCHVPCKPLAGRVFPSYLLTEKPFLPSQLFFY